MGKNEASRDTLRHQVGTKGRHRTGFGQFEGNGAVVSRLTSAFVRAALMALLIAVPSLMLPDVSSDTTQIVVLVAILAFLLTLTEYFSQYPSIVEFRFAPPFNRLRFIALFATVLMLSMIMAGKTDPTNMSTLVTKLGTLLARPLISPIRRCVWWC